MDTLTFTLGMTNNNCRLLECQLAFASVVESLCGSSCSKLWRMKNGDVMGGVGKGLIVIAAGGMENLWLSEEGIFLQNVFI